MPMDADDMSGEAKASSNNKMSKAARFAWSGAMLGVLVVAATLVGHRCGAGLICPGMFVVLLGTAIVGIARSFIRNKRLRAMGTFAIVAVLAITATVYVYYQTSPGVLFRRYVADPIPPSVRILGCEYQGGRDDAVYLHFKVEPGDLPAILKKHPYVKTAHDPGPFGPSPDWWKSRDLAGSVTYVWQPDGPPNSAAWLWLDESRMEVYFTHWSF